MQPNEKQRLLSLQDALATALANISDATANAAETKPVIERMRALKDKVDRAVTELEAGKSNMATMPNSRRTSLLASLISVFKAVPEDQLEDLRDALNLDVLPRDPTGTGNYVPNESEVPASRHMSASGNGAPEAVGTFSADSDHGDDRTQMYQQFSERFDRIEETQKAQAQHTEKVLEVLETLCGMRKGDRFPEGETKKPGEQDEEPSDEDIEKGNLRTGTVGGLMDRLSGRLNRVTQKASGLSMNPGGPPNFALSQPQIAKAQTVGQRIDALLNDPATDHATADNLLVLKSRLAAYSDGQISLEQVYDRLRLPAELQPTRTQSRIAFGG